MEDLIRKQTVLNMIDDVQFGNITHKLSQLHEAVFNLPSAQKKGQWVYDAEAYPLGNPYGHYDCDQCGESVPRKTNFCPNCGADMRGEDDERNN